VNIALPVKVGTIVEGKLRLEIRRMPDDESPGELEDFVADRVPNNEGEDGLGPSLPQTTSLKQPVNSPSKNFEGRNTRAAIRLQ